MLPLSIRAALPADEKSWRAMWASYGGSFGTGVPGEVTERTWKRILDPESAVMCIVAEVEGQVYGFAHCVVHESTRRAQPLCRLEDLFVVPSARGRGIGTALVDWLRHAMRAEGWASLYWTTTPDDPAARRLSGRFAEPEDRVRYVIARK